MRCTRGCVRSAFSASGLNRDRYNAVSWAGHGSASEEAAQTDNYTVSCIRNGFHSLQGGSLLNVGRLAWQKTLTQVLLHAYNDFVVILAKASTSVLTVINLECASTIVSVYSFRTVQVQVA